MLLSKKNIDRSFISIVFLTALTSQLPHTSQTAVSKQRFLSREEKGSLTNIKTNDSDKEAVVERCIFEDPEIKKPTLSTWTSARRAKTADAVSCFIWWKFCVKGSNFVLFKVAMNWFRSFSSTTQDCNIIWLHCSI